MISTILASSSTNAHGNKGMNAKHLTQIELSRRWNISPRTLERWRWLAEGPPFLKIGGRVLYRLEDVEAFEASQLRQHTPRRRKSRANRNSSTDGRNA